MLPAVRFTTPTFVLGKARRRHARGGVTVQVRQCETNHPAEAGRYEPDRQA
jgi:hypothetical protein